VKNAKKEITVDIMGITFSKAMIVFTIIGIITMVVPAIIYFLGYSQYIPQTEVSKYWIEPAVSFWMHIKGSEIHGYSWIFKNLRYTDCLSMLGVLILMLTPLFSILAGMIKAENKIFRILLFLSAIEFIVSIIFKGS